MIAMCGIDRTQMWRQLQRATSDAMSEKIKQVKEGEAAAKEAAKEAKAKTKKEA